jgi:hypothetical protein
LIPHLDYEAEAQAIETGFAREGIRGVFRAQLAAELRRGDPHWGIVRAQQFAFLGDAARTCAALRGGIQQHEPALLYLNVDPAYAVVRASPCYGEAAQQIGLPQLPGSSSPQRH